MTKKGSIEGYNVPFVERRNYFGISVEVFGLRLEWTYLDVCQESIGSYLNIINISIGKSRPFLK